MGAQSPHPRVREDWLALSEEPILSPEQPILDAHHHLWDRPEGRYRSAELLADVRSGHDVRASLFVQCRTGYRETGPEPMMPLGEVETVLDWSRAEPAFPAGIVGFADLQLGDRIAPVLDAMIDAAKGRLCGIRNTTAYHPDPLFRSNSRPAPDGLLCSDAFRAGARQVAQRGLVLDVWAYQTQLGEVLAVTRDVPELTVVIDHCGGPLGLGDYRSGAGFAKWRDAMADLARLPNTTVKIGGFGLTVMGYRYFEMDRPPSSDRLARDWRAHVETCLDLFGPQRAMFQSNFPVDKGQFSYRTLWNAFKRLAAPLAVEDRDDLFWRSACRIYGIDAAPFQTALGRGTS
ncbi:MAG: amidohydrolase family protein [Pseudomonadota bacterium]|nr:amidohydrolase family protein [Pseudomonadota bacterium]